MINLRMSRALSNGPQAEAALGTMSLGSRKRRWAICHRRKGIRRRSWATTMAPGHPSKHALVCASLPESIRARIRQVR